MKTAGKDLQEKQNAKIQSAMEGQNEQRRTMGEKERKEGAENTGRVRGGRR